jgi:serine/threonine protein kinase
MEGNILAPSYYSGARVVRHILIQTVSLRSSVAFILPCMMIHTLGSPKKFDRFILKPLEQCLTDTGRPLVASDIEGAAALMRKCLQLDPKNRTSVKDLLEDKWLSM